MRTLQLTAIAIASATTAAFSTTAPAEIREVEFHDATLVYSDTGPADAQATPLVLVHGWASAHTFWHKQIDAFSEDRRVIALNLPGHGASEDVEDEHSMDLYADAIAAVMDHAGVENAVIAGHSNGVPTVRQFYRNYTPRVVAFIGVDGAFENLTPEEQGRQFLAGFEGEDYLDVATRVFSGMQAAIKHEEDRTLVRETMLATPQRVMVGGLSAALDPAIKGQDKIAAPLLVINADAPFWTDDYMDRVRALSDDIEIKTLEDVSHFLFMDDPEQFNAIVMAFLNDRDL